jgi:hypothetical protein
MDRTMRLLVVASPGIDSKEVRTQLSGAPPRVRFMSRSSPQSDGSRRV